MAAINIAGKNNNYFKLQVPETSKDSRTLVLPDQNSTLATVDDVFQLGSPWNFIGIVDITNQAPLNPKGGDAYVNKVEGNPDASWLGLDPSKTIPVDALVVADERSVWHELASSEIDPIFQASPSAGIEQDHIDDWHTAFGWGDHSVEGYLTEEEAINLGYDEYSKSIWAQEDTIDKIDDWDTAFGWGDHNGKYVEEEVDPIFTSHVTYDITKDQIDSWNDAYLWGNHNNAGYLTEVKKLNEVGDVNAPIPGDGQVLTYDSATELWKPVTPVVLVDGELIYQGSIDMVDEAYPYVDGKTPTPGHIWVHIGKEDDPYTLHEANPGWIGPDGNPVNVKYGDKVAYGNDNSWHNIGSASQGTDLSAFKSEVITPAVEGGDFFYDSNTGVMSYTKTDAYTKTDTFNLLFEKADKEFTYTKDETYNKVEVDALLESVVDENDVYTKEEIDRKLWFFINDSVYLNNSTTTGFVLPAGANGMTAGPITLSPEAIVDIPPGSEWSVVGGGSGGVVMDTTNENPTPVSISLDVDALRKEVTELREQVKGLLNIKNELIKGNK
jgi:hypothetical protein